MVQNSEKLAVAVELPLALDGGVARPCAKVLAVSEPCEEDALAENWKPAPVTPSLLISNQ